MRLFLASSLDKTLPLIAPRLPQGGRVLFIANAADSSVEQWWVENDRTAFLAHGFTLSECDLRTLSPEDFSARLADAEIVHVAGGVVLYLLGLLKERGLGQALVDAVRAGRIAYTGTSAGAMIVAPSVWACQYDEDERKYAQAAAPAFAGLGLVPLLVMPHANAAECAESNAAAMMDLASHAVPLLTLRDTQALEVIDDTWRLLEAAA